MASLQDIATDVGVSVATVSAVLSNNTVGIRVSDATRRKVRQSAGRLRYRPNLSARGLRTGRTYAVGLLFFSFRELIYAELQSEIQTLLSAFGYSGICATWDTRTDAEKAFRTVIDRGVDGLVTSHGDLSLLPSDKPSVLLFQDDGANDCVCRDGEVAMQRAVDHLLDLGHRRFGTVDVKPEPHQDLIRDALRKRGVETEPFWTYDADLDFLAGSRRCMTEILDLPPETRPTALICRNDTVAMSAISEAGRRGLHVPRDVSIVGFDGVSLGALANPPLTSVGIPPAELARHVVDLMIRRLNTPEAPRTALRLKPDLIARNSSAPPPEHAVSGPTETTTNQPKRERNR